MNNALFETGCVGSFVICRAIIIFLFKLVSSSFFFLCDLVATAVGYDNKISLSVLCRRYTAFKTENLFEISSFGKAAWLSSDTVLIQNHCTGFMLSTTLMLYIVQRAAFSVNIQL